MIKILKKDRRITYSFIIILLFKILLSGFFNSDYQKEMFEPFVMDFITGVSDGRWNIYHEYYQSEHVINFPYPSVMLFIMCSGALILNIFKITSLFVSNIVFKLPLMVADIVIFWVILKIYPEKPVRCIWGYFASPIILYASYMHGQLDIIPTMFLMLAIYYISYQKNCSNFTASSVFLAMATLSKFHVFAVVPMILIYIYKRYSVKYVIKYILIYTIITIIGIVPFWSDGFIEGVVFNKELQALFMLFFSYGNVRLYIVICVILILYFYIISLNIINRDLLFAFCGIIFSSFLVFCIPMPGWYIWIVPFMAYFIVCRTQHISSITGYLGLQLFYIVYFVFGHVKKNICDLYFLNNSCNFLKLNFQEFRNICFTLLSATLIYIMYTTYKFCINEDGAYQFKDKSFVIGICGDSGSGKSTLQDRFSQLFNPDVLLRIEGDGDHKWERGDENWKTFTHLNPKANYLYRQAKDIANLKKGHSVRRTNYDHSTGKFTKDEIVYPKRFISLSGLHTLYLPQLRDNIDLKIYMDADEELRCYWKTNRDAGSRGHTVENVIKQIRERYDDAAKYILPQKEYADMVIHYYLYDKESESIGFNMKITTVVDIEEICEVMQENGINFSYEFSDDFRYQIASYVPDKQFSGIPDFEAIALKTIKNRYDISVEPFEVADVCDGIIKIILLKAISDMLEGVN